MSFAGTVETGRRAFPPKPALDGNEIVTTPAIALAAPVDDAENAGTDGTLVVALCGSEIGLLPLLHPNIDNATSKNGTP